MSLKFSFSLLLFSLISTLSTAQFGGTGSAPAGTGTAPGGVGTTPGGTGTTPGGAVTSPSGVGSAPGGTSAAPAGGTATGGGGGATVELWCVAKNNAEDTALQSALDWACGPGGANCGPIQPGGSCYDPKDIQKTASYVFNDYFIKHGMTEDACNFDNTAALISINPSHNGCKFPSRVGIGSGSGSNLLSEIGVEVGLGSRIGIMIKVMVESRMRPQLRSGLGSRVWVSGKSQCRGKILGQGGWVGLDSVRVELNNIRHYTYIVSFIHMILGYPHFYYAEAPLDYLVSQFFGFELNPSKNSSGSSSGSTNGGLSPSSEDLSSGSSILRRWMYILMAINLLFASQLIF
uniref:X8 domain-containing protein n=1 Tax=Solanum tuberosum TaxID=4113 RepID=M1AJU0_SOLTU